LLWAALFGVLGFFLPDLLLINKASHRSEQIQNALPDSLDLLTISVESGLAFDAALAQVARNTDGPLSEEFTRVLQEIQIGSGRSDALRALSERTDVDDLRIFLNSMVQAEKLGIPIADVLRVQAADMRLKRSQRIEEQAMKLPVKMIFPLILCIMPAMFVVILGPAVIAIYQTLLG
jgi:tight adherence protein C